MCDSETYTREKSVLEWEDEAWLCQVLLSQQVPDSGFVADVFCSAVEWAARKHHDRVTAGDWVAAFQWVGVERIHYAK